MSTPDVDLTAAPTVVTYEHTDEDRQRFRDAVAALRTTANRITLSERVLMVIGGVMAPLGLVVIGLGWWGASRMSNTVEQIPYLISGGLLGLGLVFLGGFFYFAHWMTEVVRENRRHSQELLGALAAIQRDVLAAVDGSVAASPARPAAGQGAATDDALYATQRGSMAHRADCVVIAGKPDLRRVGPDEGLTACKLCEPFASR